ncbi:MFS transporter [Paraburkholderia rhynchosiae]|uniref:4-hydroxybenzoate transporter PcaK n=1 Tax=Paraburkholderia rhynchosiae TaxID=487049 RepID=A0A2N7W6W3_9BURK|nr:aromatic acid/H+ symport family MFS transporter [Paraburkholderia rhynchosiae]PMS25138.1 MFS transporter [Paraburkholderia rhynchosiae]CAB3714800.1 4-hydroxybenzoate transporter PcaK [Paraburkholderia rhynchosiae]
MNQIDVHSLAGEARFNGFHTLVLFWCVLMLIVDGYDLAVVGAALPSIMKDMGIDATRAGVMAGSALFGVMVGAIFLGTLADRFGRPMMICVCVALFSLFTAAAGLTHDPITFSMTRFIAGLGIGGVLPIVTAQMAEFSPNALRTRLVTLVFAGYSIGGILVALTAKQLIGSYGWQSVFFAAGLPVLLIPFIIKTMPHSMAFLVKRGRHDELRSVMKRLLPDYPLSGHEQFAGFSSDTNKDTSVRRLFEDGRGFSTTMIWVAFMTGLFMVYALSSWLTKLMAMAGYSLGSALNFVIVFNVGAIGGAVFGGWLSDKVDIKRVLIAFYAVGAVALSLMGYTRSTESLFVVVFLVGASTLGTQLLAYAYAGDFYPHAIRSTGVGFASGMGRIGAIVAPVLIGWLVSLKLPLEQNFMAIGLAGLIGAAAVTLINQTRADSYRSSSAPVAVVQGSAGR